MKNNGFIEDDDFWSIDRLMPKKKPIPQKADDTPQFSQKPPAFPTPSVPSSSPVPPTSPVPPKPTVSPTPSVPSTPTAFPTASLPQKENEKQAQDFKNEDRKADGVRGNPGIVPFSDTPEKTYTFDGGSICRVEIYKWPNEYTFFGSFKKNAATVAGMSVENAEYSPYFSFMPQFCQLTASQLRYYLFWRNKFNKGEYIVTDFSYVLLYAYELLNLPDLLDREKSADNLCLLWLAFRKYYPKLDKYLSEWLCDYCLANGVMPKKKYFEAVSPYGIKNCTLREFYFSKEQTEEPGLLLSDYSYKQSKYRTEENSSVFDTHIPLAMKEYFAYLKKRGEDRTDGKKELQRVTRTTYDGAVCVCSEKKRLDVYYSPIRQTGSASSVTDAVKYCENCVRAALGIRARFPTPSLTLPERAVIERYFIEHLPSRMLEKNVAERVESKIDERYEPSSRGFSEEEVKKIENESLAVAKKLGEAFESSEKFSVFEQNEKENESIEEKESETAVCTKDQAEKAGRADRTDISDRADRVDCTDRVDISDRTDNSEHSDYVKTALGILVREGGNAFGTYARSIGKLPGTLADEINAQAFDRYGDQALDECDGNYLLIEDYKEEIENWLNN